MRRQMIAGAAALVLCAPAIATAQSQPSSGEVYHWPAELVAFDDNAKTVSVKARLVDQEAVADLKGLKPGDRVFLTWSGFDTYADAIRRVAPYTDNRKADERFVLSAELVSTETPHQYLTVRLHVPEGSVATLKSLKAGEWVTVTSRHRASPANETIVTIKPYIASADGASD